ncbi:MAG: hypothetical protein AAB459_02035 [Patescibacteria group bacterium]
MKDVITIYEAKTNLSKYIKQAKAGKPVYFGSYGQKEVMLSAATPEKVKIKFGTASGKLKFSNKDLEGSDSDIKKLFYS